MNLCTPCGVVSVLGCAVFVALTGCGPSGADSQPSGASELATRQSVGFGSGGWQRQGQAQFLNRIRQSDPRYQTIEKAVLNENNELGLILNRNVDLESIPALMRSMLTQMNKEFPNQDLTVIVYTPTQPPVRMGTAHLDARTRQMTYTPERQ